MKDRVRTYTLKKCPKARKIKVQTLSKMQVIDGARVGSLIKQIRQQAGLTTVKLASSTVTCRSYLSRIEMGHMIPSIGWLERFSEATGTSLKQFAETLTDPYRILFSDPFVRETASCIKRISPYNRKIILEVLIDLTQKVKPALGKTGQKRK